MLCTFLFVSFAILALTSSLCNITAIDESEPLTIPLAQLDAIKCQIEAAKQQHTETLTAINGIQKLLPRQTNVYDVLLSIFSSFFGLFILHQVVKCVLYYYKLRNNTFAKLCIVGRRCASLDFRSNDPTPEDIEEYRKWLTPPFSAYLCICCCKRRPPADVLEL